MAPLEESLIEAIINAELLFVDETSLKEKAALLWLWVFVTSRTVLYAIGTRGKKVIDIILGDNFAGILMSDGYLIYRKYLNRLRCWAHLIR